MIRQNISPSLRRILEDTKSETDRARDRFSLKRLKQMKDDVERLSFRNALAEGSCLIAEIKQRSPSQGQMRRDRLAEAPDAYKASRAVKAVSVLTNQTYFGTAWRVNHITGVNHMTGCEGLKRLKERIGKPVLRKDFITEEYQVCQARAFGADAILLMANILDAEGLLRLSDKAFELGMDVLFETHCAAEIEDLPETAKIVGINCRNFEPKAGIFSRFWFARFVRQWFGGADLSVSLKRFEYCHHLPDSVIRVAESGVTLDNCSDVLDLGFDAILVGTSLLTSKSPVAKVLSKFEQMLTSHSAARVKTKAACR